MWVSGSQSTLRMGEGDNDNHLMQALGPSKDAKQGCSPRTLMDSVAEPLDRGRGVVEDTDPGGRERRQAPKVSGVTSVVSHMMSLTTRCGIKHIRRDINAVSHGNHMMGSESQAIAKWSEGRAGVTREDERSGSRKLRQEGRKVDGNNISNSESGMAWCRTSRKDQQWGSQPSGHPNLR